MPYTGVAAIAQFFFLDFNFYILASKGSEACNLWYVGIEGEEK